ncbi:hypothetical protein [Cereibacter sphaeroides]|uniref:hypothetical protein n=1 Tax=Cereibacter sphaeroides TaxID=1063 RepID=UPI00313F27C3
MILPLALRDAARFAGRWNTLWTSHWTVSLPQALIIAGLSWLIALACFLGLVLWTAAISKGWAQSQNAAFESLKLSLLYNGPTALRGAVLALLVLLLIDARDAALHRASILRSFTVPTRPRWSWRSPEGPPARCRASPCSAGRNWMPSTSG